MGTGVSPARITTRNVLRFFFFLSLFFLCPRGTLKTKQHFHLPYFFFLRKEVIQPHLPIRLPCYDFTPVTGSTFDSSLP